MNRKVLHIGIMSYQDYKKRTMAIVRGEYRPPPTMNIKGLRFIPCPCPVTCASANFMNMKLRFHHSLCPRRARGFICFYFFFNGS